MKTPIRSCVGCRRKGDRAEFIRIVRTPEGAIVVDESGKAPGRGAYLCRSEECLKKALKGPRLSRALRAAVDPDVVSRVAAMIANTQPGG